MELEFRKQGNDLDELFTPFENAQRWMDKNTFNFLLLNDDNMLGELKCQICVLLTKKKKKAMEENFWTADANSNVSDSQLNNCPQIV